VTEVQIKNWRTVLVGIVGPYALIMPESEIEKFRDKLQNNINKLDVKEED
jgi:hypothetical protein